MKVESRGKRIRRRLLLLITTVTSREEARFYMSRRAKEALFASRDITQGAYRNREERRGAAFRPLF